MKATSSPKPRRSHYRATQQGITRVGVHQSVLKTVQRAVDDVQENTGKRLRPGELLDWLAGAGVTLTKVGTFIAEHRPYKVLIDTHADQAIPFVTVVDGLKEPAITPTKPLLPTKREPKQNIEGSETQPRFEFTDE